MVKKNYLRVASVINKTWVRKYGDHALPPTEIREFIISLAINFTIEFPIGNEDKFKEKIWEVESERD